MSESKLTKADSAAEGQNTELETPRVGNAEHLVLVTAMSASMQGSHADGDEQRGSRASTYAAKPPQRDDTSAQTAFDQSRNSTDIVQNCSTLISTATNKPVAESPQAEEKGMTKKRKNRPDDDHVGFESTGIRRPRQVGNYHLEHSHPEHAAGPLAQLNSAPYASAIENRTIRDHFHQSMPMSALNPTRMPQGLVSMSTAYAAANVGPALQPTPPSFLASALRQQEAARLAAALRLSLVSPPAGHVPVRSPSQRPGIPALSGAYGVPMHPPMMASQGFPPLSYPSRPVLPSLLLQQHLLPTRNLLDLHQYDLRHNHHSTTNPSPLQVAATFGPRMLPYAAPPHHHSGLGGLSTRQSGGVLQHTLPTSEESIGASGALFRPVILFQASDETKLSPYQILLRQQIEVFCASEDDVTSHARGRNKPITLRQVGIRCRHCSRTTWNRREKGSAYFPQSLQGIYQAAQNMGASHFNDPICSQMPAALQVQFAVAIARKSSVGSGKHYWAESARKFGLVDTDRGIRTIFDAVSGVL